MKLIPVSKFKDPIWNIAKRLALQSPINIKIGAVITDKRGRILATGFNHFGTHPKFSYIKEGFGPSSMHAECTAIYNLYKRCKRFPDKLQLYVYRRNDNLALPCKSCLLKIKEFKIDKVYYSV